MRKVILDLAVSLDGFIEGPNGEIDWCIMDDDMNFDGFLSSIDTIFYGRVSYDTWGNFQADINASEAEQKLWQAVHAKKKYVFSSQNRQDNKAAFINSDIVNKVAEIKKQDGKDIWLYGGANLINTFIQLGLIDTYRISVHPIALGKGKPLFENLEERIGLKLINANVFKSGVVQLVYEPEKPEFWESSFIEKQEMWGFEPSKSTVLTKDFFIQKSVKNILIPGIGYGRNAQIFRDNGIIVTGIEISKTAIEMARKHYGTDLTIYHGSVTDMPFDNCQYDGVFCYALIHLLDSSEREKLINDCYNQLTDNGYMVFVAISKAAYTYGKGRFVSKDRYEIFDGVKMYFYDKESIHAEFDRAGLFEITEVNESFPFFLIKCRKTVTKYL